MQLHFTSESKRKLYLKHTEDFLQIIEPQKEYPFDFVCFKITDYHPKNLPQELIDGQTLIDDLRVFLWKLSGQVNDKVSQLDEKVYTMEQLAGILKVSGRTLNRWRQKGLLARKYTFQGGIKRLAVSQSNLDKFIENNPELTKNRKPAGRLTFQEKKLIIAKIKKIAGQTKFRHHAIEVAAKETNRSPETIRKVINEYQQQHPKRKLFSNYKYPLNADDAAKIYKLYKQNTKIEQLVLKFNRSKSYIYRIIRRKKAETLLGLHIQFIYSDEFIQPDAEIKILKLSLNRLRIIHSPRPKLDLKKAVLNQYMQNVKDIPRLSRQRELELFRKYNFLKFLAADSLEKLHENKYSSIHIRRIEKCLNLAEDIKNIIIESNLALVITIAGKHTTASAPLQELVSEGNLCLMKAVEGFDYTRGFRFATYVSWIIAKDFARKYPSGKLLDRTHSASMDTIQRDFRLRQTIDFGAIERARNSLVQVIKEELDQREQFVIMNHYGLVGSQIIKQTKTLRQIGDELGLTAERVRQIELTALQKLKQSLSIEEFELLTS